MTTGPEFEPGDGIRRFLPESKRYLEEKGYFLTTLTGLSYNSLKERVKKEFKDRFGGCEVSLDSDVSFREHDKAWYNRFPQLLEIPSRRTEVAIHPDKGIHTSQGGPDKRLWRTPQKIEEWLYTASHMIKVAAPDAECYIGQIPDCLELTLNYLNDKGNLLFGKDINTQVMRTETLTPEGKILVLRYVPLSGSMGMILNSQPNILLKIKDDEYDSVWGYMEIVIPSQIPLGSGTAEFRQLRGR